MPAACVGRKCLSASPKPLIFMAAFMSLVLTSAATSGVLAETAAPVNLDLTATDANASSQHSQAVNITVGGQTVSVNPGDHLTTAEQIAVSQVLSTQHQTIVIAGNGAAIGGTVNLNTVLTNGTAVSALNIPVGVTAYNDFGVNPTINVLGNFVNGGTLFGFSTNSAVTNAVIQAANITNQTSGLITTNPIAGLPQFQNVVGVLNLQLIASNNFINSGTISSSGNLSVVAGGSITNATLNSLTNFQPVMQALNALTLVTGTGSLVNEGTLSSLRNNVNISTILNDSMSQLVTRTGLLDSIVSGLPGASLSVLNQSGRIEALAGAINFFDANDPVGRNLSITGGALAANQLNLNVPCGTLTIDGAALSGTLNVLAGSAAINSTGANLSIGKLIITGDPVIGGVGVDLNVSGFQSAADFLTYDGQSISIDEGTYIQAPQIKFHAINNISVGAGSYIQSTGQVEMTSEKGGIVIYGGLTGEDRSGTIISGDKGVLISAHCDVEVGDQVKITSSDGNLSISSQQGNVSLGNNVSVSSSYLSGYTADVSAAKNITIGQCTTFAGDVVSFTADNGNICIGRDSKVYGSSSVTMGGDGLADVTLGRNSVVGVKSYGCASPDAFVAIEATGDIKMSNGSSIKANKDVTLKGANLSMNPGSLINSQDGQVYITAPGEVYIGSRFSNPTTISAASGISILTGGLTLGKAGVISSSSGAIGITATGAPNGSYINIKECATVTAPGIWLTSPKVSNDGFIGYKSFANGLTISSKELQLRGLPDIGTVKYGVGINTSQLDNAGTISSQRNVWILSSSGLNIHNTGTISAGYYQLYLGSQCDLQVDGNGQLNSYLTNLVSVKGGVSVSQESISGTVYGSAHNSFDVSVSCNSLYAASMTAQTGSMHINAARGIIWLEDGSTVSALQELQLTGRNGVSVGSFGSGGDDGPYEGRDPIGVTIKAGSVKPGFDATSTDFYGYNVDAFATEGPITISSSNGFVSLGSGVKVNSIGGDIQVVAQKDIWVGENSSFFAQGGNVILNGAGNAYIGEGTSFTAVGREIPAKTDLPPGTPIEPPSGQENKLPNFKGGDIAIDVHGIVPNYGNFLHFEFDLARVAEGKLPEPAKNIFTTGSIFNVTNGGTVNLTAGNISAIYASHSIFNANGAVIYIDPLSSIVSFSGVTFNAFGPAFGGPHRPPIVPPIPPGTPGGPSGPTPPAPPTPPTPPVIPTSSTILPTDSTARHIPVVFSPQPLKPQVISLSLPGDVKDDQMPQFISTSDCQPFLLQSRDKNNNPCLSIVAAGGTVIEPVYDQGGTVPAGLYGSKLANRTLSLKEGRMVVISGPDQQLKVRTNNAEIALAPGSVNMIEQLASGTTRINVMSGATTHVVMLAKERGVNMEATAGEEILIGNEDEELIPDDGVGRELVEAKVVVMAQNDAADRKAGTASNPRAQKHDLSRKVKVEKHKFDVAKMGDQDKLFVCMVCTQMNCKDGQCERVRSRIGDVIKKNNQQKDNGGDGSRLGTSPIRPIAFVGSPIPPPIASGSKAGIHTVQTDTTMAKYVRGKSIGVDANKVVAAEGEQIICAKKDTVMHIGEHLLTIKPGTTLFVKKEGDVISVCNIWDERLNAVCAYFGKRTVHLGVGEEFTIGPKTVVPSKTVKESTVSRRQVRNLKLSGDENIMLSEISIPSLLGKSTLMRQIAHSDDSGDRVLMRKLSKMGAIISMVGYRRGPYSALNNQ